MYSDVLHVLVRQLDWKLCVKSNLDGDDGRSARWRNLSAHAGRPVDGSESEFSLLNCYSRCRMYVGRRWGWRV